MLLDAISGVKGEIEITFADAIVVKVDFDSFGEKAILIELVEPLGADITIILVGAFLVARRTIGAGGNMNDAAVP